MKQALALLVNDLHCDQSNIEEFNKNWKEAIDVAKKYNVLDIFVGGDIFTSQSSQTLPVLFAVKEALINAVGEDKFNINIVDGNHDKPNKESTIGYCNIFKNNHHHFYDNDIYVYENGAAVMWEDCDYCFVMMPYFAENIFEQKLNDFLASTQETKYLDKDKIVLYLHQGISGGMGMEVPGELPKEIFDGYHAVLCSHYHDRKHIPDTQIYYIGSSRQHNFGEDEEKGYTLFYDDGSWEFVKNEVNTRYKTFEIDLAEIGSFEFTPQDGYKYRLKVNCSEKEAKNFDKQKFLDMGFSKVEVKSTVEKSKETVTVSIDEKYDKVGITKEYQNFCNEKDIDAKLGVEYLNKID